MLKGTQTSPVRGNVRASSSSFVICPSADSLGDRWSTNCASAQRCELITMDVTCMAAPSSWFGCPASGPARPCTAPPPIMSAAETSRSRPRRSRPQTQEVHIMRNTFMELIKVRPETVRYSSALFVRPISKPWMLPKITSRSISCLSSGGRCCCGLRRYTTLERRCASRPVVICTTAVSANGYGKMPCAETVRLICMMARMAAVHHKLVKVKTSSGTNHHGFAAFRQVLKGAGVGGALTRT
mmetsp:Transcript_24862/g.51705  ORF Transcript_24862/g.51705 Transcript_24862/m.51705 type:complete len:241 (+) Transcript_24862:384-1106(+)